MDAEENGGSFESLSTIQPSVRRLDPFWATRLWHRLSREALSKVRVCRQRYFLKNYEEVFNGEDLVTVVLQFLKECAELDTKRIERINAIKVCQVLMDKKLFESVSPKGNSKFEDNSHRFYRFTDDKITQENTIENSSSEKNSSLIIVDEDKENINNSSYGPNSSSLTSNFIRSARRQSMRLKTPLLKVRETRPSPVRLSKRSFKCSEDSQENACLLRETALTLLLQLVDVPILETILSVPYDLHELPEAPQPFVLESDFTPRKVKPAKVDFKGPIADIPWVKAASACLNGLHPAGIAGLWSLQACKLLCYRSVVERFSCSAESLIPGEYFSVCIPIVNMLKNDCRHRALYALQLLVYILPWKRQNQLKNLLHFLHLVVNDIFVSIDKKVTNYEAVLRDFLSVVFKHPLISDDTQKILFDFLLLKATIVFQIPLDLNAIRESGFKFCKTISEEDLATSSAKFTEQNLYDLAMYVVDSTQIKLADKKSWLKKLKKHHNKTYKAFNFGQ